MANAKRNKQQRLILIGKSDYLQKIPDAFNGCIDTVYFGWQYAIYSDKHHANIYSSGYNEHGQCSIGNDDEISEFTQIKYFNKPKINMRKICVNVSSDTTFWISTTNKLYGNGRNDFDQLGMNSYTDRTSPELIFYLQHIVDVQSADDYSIALCDNSDQLLRVIACWSGFTEIPWEILQMILTISGKQVSKVYSTPFFCYHGNAMMKRKWKEIDIFKEKNISKIRTGHQHSLFLESNGTIWSCGNNDAGQIGLGHNKYISKPTIISRLVQDRVSIKMIECGSDHNIAVDYNYNVYSWGCNKYGQCGDGTLNNVNEPKLIEYLKEYVIHAIGCGYSHSYCKTSDGEYFMFGSNKYNECLTYDGKKYVWFPCCINQIFEQYNEGKKVIRVVLGYCNTAIFVNQ